MARHRRDDQAVDAFSAPKELLEEARKVAYQKRMTKSGFYRYCLAKEMGFSENECLRLAEHASVYRMYGPQPDEEEIGLRNKKARKTKPVTYKVSKSKKKKS